MRLALPCYTSVDPFLINAYALTCCVLIVKFAYFIENKLMQLWYEQLQTEWSYRSNDLCYLRQIYHMSGMHTFASSVSLNYSKTFILYHIIWISQYAIRQIIIKVSQAFIQQLHICQAAMQCVLICYNRQFQQLE